MNKASYINTYIKCLQINTKGQFGFWTKECIGMTGMAEAGGNPAHPKLKTWLLSF